MTGAELRAARVALGLTQRRLASLLGVQQSTVWRWEAERTLEPPRMVALALATIARAAPLDPG